MLCFFIQDKPINKFNRGIQQIAVCFFYRIIYLDTNRYNTRFTARRFDSRKNKLQIKRQVSPSKNGKTVTTLKTDNSVRMVEIPQILVNVLSEYMSNHDSVWMFPSPVKTDQPLNPHTIYRKKPTDT